MVSLIRAAVKSFKKRVSLKVKCLRKAPEARDFEEGDLFPVSTDESYLPDASNIQAESLIGDDIIAATTVSATGEGVHTRWIYPEESASFSSQSTLLPASPASSSTLLDSTDEMEVKKLTIRIPVPKKRPTIRIPASKLSPSADSPSSLVFNGCSDTEVKEKLIITIPASKKRSRSTDDEDAVFVRHTRPRRFASAPSPAIIIPTKPEGDLIYSGINAYTDPVVVTTSATGQGMHTRWIYPTGIVSASASANTELDHSGWDAEDEASCGSGFDVPEKDKKLTITIPPLKNLKRARDIEDDDCIARRTRSRLSASSPSSSISTLSTILDTTTSSDSSLVMGHGACYSSPPRKAIRASKRSSKKSKKN